MMVQQVGFSPWMDTTTSHQPKSRFGMAGYRDILNMAPAVKLTPHQYAVTLGVEAITQSRNLQKLPQHLDLLKTESYRHILDIRHVQMGQTPWTVTRRKRFHSPFTDLFLRLPHFSRQRLITALSQATATASKPQTAFNAAEALVDLYAYVLRPQGRGAVETWWHPLQSLQTRLQRKHLLGSLKTLLTQPAVPASHRRMLHLEIRLALADLKKKQVPHFEQTVLPQLHALLSLPLPAYPITPVNEAAANELKTAIRKGDIGTLQGMIWSGQMAALIPEWKRIAGPNNHQHGTQDHTLDLHLLKTLKATQASPYYQLLSPEEQFRVSSAAFFHDMKKRTGPANFRAADRISADPRHPERTAEAVLEVLPSLGYTPSQVEDIHVLIEYHQALGNLIKPFGDPDDPEHLQAIARGLGNRSRLLMLQALTEGDIRSVKRDEPGRGWFTPQVAQKVDYYVKHIGQYIDRENGRPKP